MLTSKSENTYYPCKQCCCEISLNRSTSPCRCWNVLIYFINETGEIF